MKSRINFVFTLTVMLISACNSQGQTEAQKEAKKTAEAIKTTMGKPDMVAASANGYFMKATIDGKPWEAVYMYPTEKPNSVGTIYGEKGEPFTKGSISIGIPVKTIRRWIEVGKKYQFGEGRAVDFYMGEDTYGGYIGELTITKVDDKWVEGTFYFTATSSSVPGKHEITNGSFRVAITKEN